jgi:hypothetical protein
MENKVKNYVVKTVTPFATEFIVNNAKNEKIAQSCCLVEINAVRDVLNSVRSCIKQFCPSKKYCYQNITARHPSCDNCDYMRERMQYIKEHGKLTLNENYKI